MHLAPKIKKSNRELLEQRAQRWVAKDTAKDRKDGYLEYLGEEFCRKHRLYQETDFERVHRRTLLGTDTNKFTYLVGSQYAVPTEVKYSVLNENELGVFELEYDAQSAPPKKKKMVATHAIITGAPVSTINLKNPSPVVAMAPGKTHEMNGEEEQDEEDRLKNAFEKSQLEQIMQETVATLLMEWKIPKNPFVGSSFPFDNPFAVRLERGGGVVPDNYFDIVKTPMDLSKIKDRIHSEQYRSFADFERDVHLIISNSFSFHPPKTMMHDLTKKFDKFSTRHLSKAKTKLSRILKTGPAKQLG